MNIAHLIPYSVSYPLKRPNGRYDWVARLAQAQAAAGHDVTIYGGPDSQLQAVTTKSIQASSSETENDNLATIRLAFQNQHDVYHSHFDALHYQVANETSKPIVATQHWWPSPDTIQASRSSQVSNVWAVPPTEYMYDFDKEQGIQSRGSIPHGIDLSLFQNQRSGHGLPTGRLLFVGRISPEKNVEIAIRVAKATDYGLDIIGKVTAKNAVYWAGMQHNIDGEQIRFLGTKDATAMAGYFSAASATLCPYDATEAFGLVAIESQACGTPVLMKAGGSRGELVQDGVTGFLCNTVDDFVTALSVLPTMDSEACRAFAEKFSLDDMVVSYDRLYRSLINASDS